MQNRRLYALLGLLFALAFAVRSLLAPLPFYSSQPLVPEKVTADGYYELANNLIAGNGFSRFTASPFATDSVRTPLYPLFLVSVLKVFGSYKAVFFLQAVLGSLSALLAYFIAKEFLSPAFAIGTGFLAALEPYTAYLSGVIVTETLFTFLFFLGLYWFLRYLKEKNIFLISAVGCIFGIATLVKPTIQYLPFALLLVMWLASRRIDPAVIKHVALFIGTFLLVLSPWLYRNYEVFGNASLAVQPVSNLYAYLVPSAIALEEHVPYQQAADEFFAKEHVGGIEDVNLGNASAFRTRALAELSHHPVGFLESAGITMVAFFTNDAYASMLTNLGTPLSFSHPPVSTLWTDPGTAFSFLSRFMSGPGALVILGRIFWILATLLALMGAYLFFKKRRFEPGFLTILGAIAYFALTTIVIGLAVNGRFRVPVDPLIFILALYALETVFKKRPHGLKPV